MSLNKKTVITHNIILPSDKKERNKQKYVNKVAKEKIIEYDLESSDKEIKKSNKKISKMKIIESDLEFSDKEIKKYLVKDYNKNNNNNDNNDNNNDNNDNNDNKNNKIWKHICKCINYDCNDERTISANDIKNASNTWEGTKNQFEPRLLCKQDTSDGRPEIFKKNNICILSIENGKYLLTKNNIYIDLEYQKVKHTDIKKNSLSLLLKLGNSESTLIDNLRYSGIFEKNIYLNEEIKYGSLLN